VGANPQLTDHTSEKGLKGSGGKLTPSKGTRDVRQEGCGLKETRGVTGRMGRQKGESKKDNTLGTKGGARRCP